MRSKWRLNMAVFQTSKAGINGLHHQSNEPIYTDDKYGKHRPFVLPQTANIQKPSNTLKCMSRSLHLASFSAPRGALNQSPSAVIFFISSRAHVRRLIFFLPICTWVDGIHSVCLLAGGAFWSKTQLLHPFEAGSSDARSNVSATLTRRHCRAPPTTSLRFHPPLPKYNHTVPPWRCTEELKRSTSSSPFSCLSGSSSSTVSQLNSGIYAKVSAERVRLSVFRVPPLCVAEERQGDKVSVAVNRHQRLL